MPVFSSDAISSTAYATEEILFVVALGVALARHPGRLITHRALLEEVWGPEYGTETHYLRVYASQVRKKLQDDPERPYLITEPGVGYRLVDPAAPD